jgi:AraC-like DNA-binding protein
MNNHLHTIAPQSAFTKYVSLYYFIKNDDPSFHSKHYSFPHTYNALSIYKNASFIFGPGYMRAWADENAGYSTVIQSKKQAPFLVDISGKTDRITILFKDFGINHILPLPLPPLMTSENLRVNLWDNDPSFLTTMDKIFATSDLDERVVLLEEFLSKKLRPVETGIMERAIELLWDFEKNYTAEEIADQLNISVRTFNRNFKQSLGVAPAEYRRIARFRHSLTNKLCSRQFKRLTDLGYQSNFYDQSYFNKIYRKLTGSNPKAFFRSVERSGDDQLIFQFIRS